MKPINAQSICNSLAAWIQDFKNDNGRYPASLDDLAQNKNAKHDYAPARVISRNQAQGYTFTYKLIGEKGEQVELTVERDEEKYRKQIPNG
ncbi:hypothetical protein FACS1894200_00250 [Spirochaetia bacterium]|nr:hypothetical protein FACS1894200_00250 [Spirochaetia bacterium]